MVELDSQTAPALRGGEPDDLELSLEDVSDYPRLQHSHPEIAKAGKVIASKFVVSGNKIQAHIEEAFLVANKWRDAHAFPMRSIHGSVRHCVRANDLEAVSAARLKRMQAIRRKLRRTGLRLHQLQDLGGCRVIVSTIAETRLLIDKLKSKIASGIFKEDDYISEPKNDGYRSHHIVFTFRHRKGPTLFDGKRIELQIRTWLQHSWATTVEAVGLYRGEELKNQKGDPDWLRFFALMSAEFAEAEKCATVPETPDSGLRKAEIRKLAKSLDALTVLESVTKGFQGTDIPLARGFKPTHYLIRYDHSTKTVHVEPYNKTAWTKATNAYEKAEEELRADDENDAVVLVEVEKIDNLKRAYPNYFGDVDLFQRQLNQIVGGGAAAEYTRAPKQPAQKRKREPWGDLRWLRGTRFPGPRLKDKSDKKKGRRKGH